MKKIHLKGTDLDVTPVVAGCMRLGTMSEKEMSQYIEEALASGVNYFDHADIYEDGKSEIVFGEALKKDSSLKREDLIIQSKCGIRKGFFDQSKEYILEAVDASLKRLQVEYLDVMLLHRPDTLVEPEEVAEAFDILEKSGKVRHFGVSNHKPSQIALLKKAVKQDLIIDQLQFSLSAANMITNGLEVNMHTPGAVDRDASVLDFCRINDITIQAWSPFYIIDRSGVYLGDPKFKELDAKIDELAEKYGVTENGIVTAWILRHPANMQMIAGTTKWQRLKEIVAGAEIELTRKEWYDLYIAAGHILP